MIKENKSKWELAGTQLQCTNDEMFTRLKNSTAKIVVLDGWSGCGKTMLLRRLQKEAHKPVFIFSDERIADIIADEARRSCCNAAQLLELSETAAVIGIEDVDLLRGRSATQAELCERIRIAAQRHLVIVTGNDMHDKMAQFLVKLGGEVWHQ